VSATYRVAEGISLLARTGSDIYRLSGDQNFARGYINSTFVNTAYQGGFLTFQDYRNENNTDIILSADRNLSNRLQFVGTLGSNFRRERFNTNQQQTTGPARRRHVQHLEHGRRSHADAAPRPAPGERRLRLGRVHVGRVVDRRGHGA
jgi:hypothetical protein